MRLTDYIKKLIRDFFTIFAIIVICITLLRQIFAPDVYLKLSDIYIYMICALVGDLPSLIFFSQREIPEKEMWLRIIIHFAILEASLLTIANIAGWISGIINTLILAVEIALIYVIVRFLLWMDNKKAANSINEKLKVMKNEVAYEPEDE